MACLTTNDTAKRDIAIKFSPGWAVRCTLSVATTEGGPPLNVYRVSASACNVPASGNCPNAAASADYVERVLSTIVER